MQSTSNINASLDANINRVVNAPQRNEDIIIPKIIHVIWAGGSALIPRGGIENIIAWQKHNPDFKIWLWVDKQDTKKNLIEKYKELLEKEDSDFSVAEMKQDLDNNDTKKYVLLIKDINAEDLKNSFVKYEIEKLDPNYGASSDLLRYQILYKYGGVYIDCTDVRPATSRLETCGYFNVKLKNHLLFLDHCSQIVNPTEEQLSSFNKKSNFGNDCFISTIANPVMEKFLKQAEENYMPSELKISDQIKLAHSSKNIKNLTIERTGPGLVDNVLKKILQQQNNEVIAMLNPEEKHYVEIRPLKSSQQFLVTSANNTGYWMQPKIKDFMELEPAIEAICATLLFEIKHCGIIRLDDFFNDYLDLLAHNECETKVNINLFLNKIPAFLEDNKMIESHYYCQLTGLNDETRNLNVVRHYKSLFNSSDEEKIEAIKYQSNYTLIRDNLEGAVTSPIWRKYLLHELKKYKDLLTEPNEKVVELINKLQQPNIYLTKAEIDTILDGVEIKKEDQKFLYKYVYDKTKEWLLNHSSESVRKYYFEKIELGMAFLTVLLSLNNFQLGSKDGIAAIADVVALLTKWHDIFRDSLAIDNSETEALSIGLKDAFEAYKNGLEQTAAEIINPPLPQPVNSANSNEDSNNSAEGCGPCCRPF